MIICSYCDSNLLPRSPLALLPALSQGNADVSQQVLVTCQPADSPLCKSVIMPEVKGLAPAQMQARPVSLGTKESALVATAAVSGGGGGSAPVTPLATPVATPASAKGAKVAAAQAAQVESSSPAPSSAPRKGLFKSLLG